MPLVLSNTPYQNVLNWLRNDSWTNHLLMTAKLDLLLFDWPIHSSQIMETCIWVSFVFSNSVCLAFLGRICSINVIDHRRKGLHCQDAKMIKVEEGESFIIWPIKQGFEAQFHNFLVVYNYRKDMSISTSCLEALPSGSHLECLEIKVLR